MRKIKLTLTRNCLEILHNWIPDILDGVKHSSLSETTTTCVMIEFHHRLNVWFAATRNPRHIHSINVNLSECSSLLYYIYRADPANDYIYMSLHQVKEQLEKVLFVKTNLKPLNE